MPGLNADAEKEKLETDKKFTRVWADGCFDMVHFGHANSLRQSKKLGDYLIVGIHSDEEITRHKGPPVFTEEERYVMVKGIKWVDEVIRSAPYVTTLQTLDKYNCEFCAHGDDITTTLDGKDTYQEVKDAKRYKEVKRTQGVSTTALVGRMLSLTDFDQDRMNNNSDKNALSPYTGSKFLVTAKKIREFSEGNQIPPGAKVVYVDGAFDVLHPGHLAFLEAAATLGDYLIVGVHSDETVTQYKSLGYPLMNVHERYFSVLGCKAVTDVVIDAPYTISAELLDHLNISVVAHGLTPIKNDPLTNMDPYEEPKRRGIYQEINSGSDLTTEKVIARIVARRSDYEERNRRKEEKELAIIKAMHAMEAKENLAN